MTLENFIYESAEEIINGNFENAKIRIIKHKDIYQDDTAICFSLLAFGSFINKTYDLYYQFMNDAQFLVEQSKDPITNILHELVLGYVSFTEKNSALYSINYNKARKLAIKFQKTDFFEKTASMLKCPPIGPNIVVLNRSHQEKINEMIMTNTSNKTITKFKNF